MTFFLLKGFKGFKSFYNIFTFLFDTKKFVQDGERHFLREGFEAKGAHGLEQGGGAGGQHP